MSIIKEILNYQKENDIKGKCVINSLFLYDRLNLVKEGCCKIVTGILFYVDDEKTAYSVCHCWCEVNGKVLDPSYEYHSIKHKKIYFSNLKEFFNTVKTDLTIQKKQYMIKNITKLELSARRMIKNTKMTDTGGYYKKLRNYVYRKTTFN